MTDRYIRRESRSDTSTAAIFIRNISNDIILDQRIADQFSFVRRIIIIFCIKVYLSQLDPAAGKFRKEVIPYDRIITSVFADKGGRSDIPKIAAIKFQIFCMLEIYRAIWYILSAKMVGDRQRRVIFSENIVLSVRVAPIRSRAEPCCMLE